MGNKSLSEILTPRQLQIASLVRDGLGDREIAQEVGLGVSTLKNYLQKIFDLLGCDNRVMVAVRYEREYPIMTSEDNQSA